ncbi:hypothetical protein KC320_g221 [Hortaea werneckii]|nr:hypothetical protein KC320_g221 [Hortaea werneckii]
MWDVERGSVVFLFKSVASSALVNAGLPEHEISKERPESHRQHDPAVISIADQESKGESFCVKGSRKMGREVSTYAVHSQSSRPVSLRSSSTSPG